jgi:hypothetical protein
VSTVEALLEAERRGLLPPDKIAALAEARRRNLIPALPDDRDAFNRQLTKDRTPDQLGARAELQSKLDRQLSEADAAGQRVRDVESQTAIARPILRGAVDLADGVLGLPRLIASAPVAGYNALTGSNIPLPISQSVADINPAARNVLAARNDTEQLNSAVTRGLGGVLFGAGVGGLLGAGAGAGSTTANVGRTLAANPGLQTAGAVTGAASSEAVRRSGAGAGAQLAAGLAGGLAPSLAQAGASALTRGAIRGGEAGRQAVEENLDTFTRAGTTPSVGQATQGRFSRAAETLLARVPGAAGRMAKKAVAQAEEFGAAIESAASRLAGRTSKTQAGEKIASGIKGPGGFVERTKAVQSQLYDNLDQQIAPDRPTSVANTLATLKELTAVDPGAARTTGNLVNSRIKQIAEDLAADTQANGGVVPYSAMKALRTRVRELQDDSGLVSDVPQKQLERLYGALSEDLREAAKQVGPAAERAWSRANTYTRVLVKRKEILDDVINKNGGPESIYNAATAGTSEGATRLRAVMQSLDEGGQKAVSATVLRRLGRAVNSQQDELSEKFSTETFLSNWAKLSSEAKSALFDRFGRQYRRDVDALSKVAANLREGSQVFKNPSGTGQAGAQIATASAAGAALTALAVGNALPAVGLGATLAGANFSSRLMTNPDFVRWLAVSTKLPPSMYTSQINQLQRIGAKNKDELLLQAAAYLKKQGGKQDDAANDDGRNRERRQ